MRIVVIDPDQTAARLVGFILGEAGHTVVQATTAAAGLHAVFERETDAVLLEAELPDLDGWELCKELRGRRYTGPLIFV
ncbi:response regulator transcription factor, partial [Sphaerobacter thermophilus]